MARGGSRRCRPRKPDKVPPIRVQLTGLENYPRENLPKYLFRSYSADSQGINEASIFRSAASQILSLEGRNSSLPSLLELDLAAFASDAVKHLTYTRDDRTFRSPLISFTSSLLVALGCARKADFESGMKRDVKIAILDTQKITSLHPIVPCADLKCLVNTHLQNKILVPGDSVDEYLAYDSLLVNGSSASMRDLMRAELFSFIPELFPRSHFRDKWPKPTLNLRNKLFVEPRAVSERDYQLLRGLSSEFHGEEYQLALTVHLLSLRDRFVETDALLKKAVTASFRLPQLQSFVRVEREYSIGPESFKVYKYTSAGHGVANSTAPELRLYSALVETMCQSLMERQDERLRKVTNEGLVNTICNPAGDALTRLDEVMRTSNVGTQLTAHATAAKSDLEAALVTWRGMGISKILDDTVLGDIKTQTETAKELAADIRATQTVGAPSSAPVLPSRRPLSGSVNRGIALTNRANDAASSSVFGSILASIDGPQKRKRTCGGENADDGGQEEKKKARKVM